MLRLLVSSLVLVSMCHSAEAETPFVLTSAQRDRALEVLREGLQSDEFWPSIHAAEGLTLGGYGAEVIAALEPKLPAETDDQQRCGLARELVRAGKPTYARVMLEILAGDDPYGHVHAAESLYKVNKVGDGKAMTRAMQQEENVRLRLMAAAAMARQGNPQAVPLIQTYLAHDDLEVRRIAVWLLGRLGSKTDIPRIRPLIQGSDEPLFRAYCAHSLAALGDPAGLAALEKNLSSDDGAIRTYAATFAGDAGATQFKDKLVRNLDDAHLDARIRAAQTLLFFAHQSSCR